MRVKNASRRAPAVRSASRYERGNLESARVILENLARYGAEDSALVQWARLVMERAQPTVRGPLFQTM